MTDLLLRVGESWYPRPELNRDLRFRKPLLYPFELRGHSAAFFAPDSGCAFVATEILPTPAEGSNPISV